MSVALYFMILFFELNVFPCLLHLEGYICYCFSFQSAIPQKGSEVNLTLGGIDLNNSGRLACFFKFTFIYSHLFIIGFLFRITMTEMKCLIHLLILSLNNFLVWMSK